jgi:hypothetical protein
MSDFWEDADIISRYTRMDAIEDGVLVDVTGWAKRAGFKLHTCLTSGVAGFIDVWDGEEGSFEQRALDLLRHCHVLAVQNQRERQIQFEYKLPGLRKATVILHIGPGDRGEPVLTIGFPEDF